MSGDRPIQYYQLAAIRELVNMYDAYEGNPAEAGRLLRDTVDTALGDIQITAKPFSSFSVSEEELHDAVRRRIGCRR